MWRAGWIGAMTIAAAAGIAGCHGSGDAAQASCTVAGSMPGASVTACEEIEGVSSADLDALRQSCGVPTTDLADGGVESSAQFMEGPCSRAGTVGGCRGTSGSATITQWYYDDGTGRLTSSDVQMICTSKGGVFVRP